MAFSHIEVAAVNCLQMRFVALKEMALVLFGDGNEARRNDQVRVESAHRAGSDYVLVEPGTHSAVCAPRSNALQTKNVSAVFEKAELRAFFSGSFKTDAAGFISRLLDTGHEQKPAEAARFVLRNASFVKTAHHFPPPASPARVAMVIFAILISAMASEEVLLAKS